MAPSGLRKGGSGLDLAIAVGVLVADERLDAQRAQAPRFDVRHAGGRADEGHFDLTADDVVQRRAAAFIRHVHDVDTGHDFQQLARQVHGAASAGRGKVDLPRPGFRQRHQLLDAFYRQRWVHHQRLRTGSNHRHRREIAHRVIRQ